MTLPLLAQDLQNAIQPVPTQVKRSGDIQKDILVRARIDKVTRRHDIIGSHAGIWVLDVTLDGGVSGLFGCTLEDMERLSGDGEVDLAGLSLIARVTTGPGPQVDDLDFEPTSVFYLTDFSTASLSLPVVHADGEALSYHMAS